MDQIMGTGSLGETKMGPDGNLYQWVEGIDGLGNPIGFWSKLKKLGRKALKTAVRYHPAAQALKLASRTARYHPAAQALRLVSRGVGDDGLGALYAAPDGSLYEMAGLGMDEEGMGEATGMGAEDLTQMMGLGSYIGETRMGPDGNVYQWIQGVDGLGNPMGFWKRWKRKLRRFVRKAIPVVQQFAPLIPGGAVVSSALKTATPFLRQAGVAGNDGLGALYQAPDGSIYQMQGQGHMQGLADEEMAGLADDDLEGFADEEMAGLGYDEMAGFAEDDMAGLGYDEMNGLTEDDLLNGYVRQGDMNGLGAYVPQQPPSTRWFQQPGQAPKIWEAPW